MKLDTQHLPGWAVGLAAGFAVAIAGAIKDAPTEGFSFLSFIRSPVIGGLVGLATEHALHVHDPKVLFLAAVGGERILVQGYKFLSAQTFGPWGIPKQLVP